MKIPQMMADDPAVERNISRSDMDVIYEVLASMSDIKLVPEIHEDILELKADMIILSDGVIVNTAIVQEQVAVAVDSAISANNYKDQALLSATSASNSVNSTNASAQSALDSKDSANLSAVSASASESMATQKALEASVSASTAMTSETNAALSASNANTSEVNSLLSEQNALQSKTNATISETNALNSAEIALAQSNIATIKANEASTSASNALISETNANGSKVMSHKWAQEAEDVIVTGTLGVDEEYSAYHWAQKALAAAGGSTSTDYYQGAYGFNWDYSTDTYIRTGAAGYTSIQSMMKRCVLNTNGTVRYYLHPTNSNFKTDGTPSVLTGADGNVMVEVPKFYVKIETVGTVDKYSISLTADDGYVVHPWFVKAGIEVPYRYFRAYTGYNSGGTLKSISGVTPTRTQTIATFRTQATANGAGWHLTDWNAVNAIKLLCYIEFNDYIVTDYIGTGNDTGNDYGLTTGQSNTIGNASSPNTNNNTWMSYRGIENFYSDVWEFLDGVNINNYIFYVNQNYTTFASNVFTGDYINKGTIIAASGSYITRCVVSVGGGWIPSVVGGSSTTYYGDGLYSDTAAKVAFFSGSAGDGAVNGAGTLNVANASSIVAVSVGGSVCF